MANAASKTAAGTPLIGPVAHSPLSARTNRSRRPPPPCFPLPRLAPRRTHGPPPMLAERIAGTNKASISGRTSASGLSCRGWWLKTRATTARSSPVQWRRCCCRPPGHQARRPPPEAHRKQTHRRCLRLTPSTTCRSSPNASSMPAKDSFICSNAKYCRAPARFVPNKSRAALLPQPLLNLLPFPRRNPGTPPPRRPPAESGGSRTPI